jgi:hypothetical protein
VRGSHQHTRCPDPTVPPDHRRRYLEMLLPTVLAAALLAVAVVFAQPSGTVEVLADTELARVTAVNDDDDGAVAMTFHVKLAGARCVGDAGSSGSSGLFYRLNFDAMVAGTLNSLIETINKALGVSYTNDVLYRGVVQSFHTFWTWYEMPNGGIFPLCVGRNDGPTCMVSGSLYNLRFGHSDNASCEMRLRTSQSVASLFQNVSIIAPTHSSSSVTLTWRNPQSGRNRHLRTIVTLQQVR